MRYLLVLIATILCSCGVNRWPKNDLDLKNLTINDNKIGNSFQLNIHLPSKSINSGKWPFIKLVELGDKVIVVECGTDSLSYSQSDTRASSIIVVNGKIGDNYEILMRDENDILIHLSSYILTGKDIFINYQK